LNFRSLVLAAFSTLYGAGVGFRLAGYTMGLLRPRTLPGFVISIGNLTAGGTGKTPAVALLAQWAIHRGYRVAVLSRGYGGAYREKVLEVSDGTRIKAGPRESGDEPHLLARRLKGVPIVLGKKRHLAGKVAFERFKTNLFILDDGFQHLGLKRDLNLVLLDAANPFGNGRILPWGPLREPVGQLKRADAFILTRSKDLRSGMDLHNYLEEGFPGRPIYHADHLPEKVVLPWKKEEIAPESLKGKRVLAFAGIARPDAFKETLLNLGADVQRFESFRDHYPFREDELRALIRQGKELGVQYVITTEKDWMRIAPGEPTARDLAYLSVRFAIAGEEAFFHMLSQRTRRKEGVEKACSFH
jgi:tetraacyldisaccharide 4'-kinase